MHFSRQPDMAQTYQRMVLLRMPPRLYTTASNLLRRVTVAIPYGEKAIQYPIGQ